MRFYLTLLVIASCHVIQAQGVYAGYRAGTYIVPEFVPRLYATRFNEGQKFIRSDDDGIIGFEATDTPASVSDRVDWGYVQQGINLGVYTGNVESAPVEIGFHQFNQTSTGTRQDPIKGREKFTLQSRSGGVYVNWLWFANRWFRPYLGLEMGTYRLRYWYSNELGDNIDHQAMGYKRGFWAFIGGSGVGDRPVYLGLNLGFHLHVLHYSFYTMDIVSQYQGRWNRIEDIDMAGKAPDLIGHHGNLSVSVVFTVDLNVETE